MYKVAVVTVSTKGAKGERVDTSGPNICLMLKENEYDVIYTNIIPDDFELIKNELLKLSDDNIDLIITTGGTGFSKTDVTPEATENIIERKVPGIPEMMRVMCYEKTKKSCLSRATCGIRKNSLILNLPGSEKAAKENLEIVLDPLKHGLDMLNTTGSANCGG